MQQRLARSEVFVESARDTGGLFIDQAAREAECAAVEQTRLAGAVSISTDPDRRR